MSVNSFVMLLQLCFSIWCMQIHHLPSLHAIQKCVVFQLQTQATDKALHFSFAGSIEHDRQTLLQLSQCSHGDVFNLLIPMSMNHLSLGTTLN